MRFAGALSILALGAGATAFAQEAPDATDKDQVIRDLQLKLGAMETRLGALEENGASVLQKQIDGTVHQSPPEAVREPRRLNISAPGLEGLDISGGVHMRGDYWGNFDDGGGNNDIASFGTEAWLAFDARISEKTRIGITAHYADVWGDDTSHGLFPGDQTRLTNGGGGTPGDNDNALSVSEAYLSVLDLYQTGIDFTGGRQHIQFGAERIIGDDEWRLNRTSFDGVRLDQNMGEGRGMWSFIAVRLEDNDNGGDLELMPTSVSKHDNANLFGLYYETNCQDVGGIDLYVFHLEDGNQPDPAIGKTRFTTYGGRWVGPDWGGLTLDAEAATQFGEFDGNRTHDYGFDTWAAHLGAGYKIEGIDFITGVHAGYDYATGGDDFSENFVQLFPTLHGWFGITDFFSWTNIEHFNLGVDVGVCEGELTVDYHWNRLATSDAGFAGYNSSAAPAGGSKSLGQELDVVYSVDCTKSTKVGIGGGWFFPGDAYHDMTGAENNILYSYIGIRTTF